MGISKRLIWSSEAKHKWHLSIGKKKRMDRLYDRISQEQAQSHPMKVSSNRS